MIEAGHDFNFLKQKVKEIGVEQAGDWLIEGIEKKADFECDWDIDARSSSLRKRDLDFRGDVNGGGPYIELSSYKGNIRILSK